MTLNRASARELAEQQQDRAAKFAPWPPGTYDFEVAFAEDKFSKAGNPMIELTLYVFGLNGERREIKDYLLEAMPQKLDHAIEACGLGAKQSVNAIDFSGRTGKLKLGIDPAKDGYSARNKVSDYIPAQSAQVAPRPVPLSRPVPAQKRVDPDLDDSIPF